ncbi:MAG: tetratricopeptide repeat protein [Candidatus Schekmanbacteria bacterium]|nr:tetratricopeptide repeat protein [Candidatus Schekmanbacteria bacterium]
MLRTNRNTLISLTLFLLIFICYAHVLSGPFIFDDITGIVRQGGVHFDRFSADNIQRLVQAIRTSGRPIAQISFALNYYLGGLHTFGYHLVNLLIHYGAGLLVYFISLSLLKPAANSEKTAAIAAILFAVHPVQTQAVSYIVQRMTSLAAFFFLLSFYFYIHARKNSRKGYWIACILSGLCAIGSKQNAVTLPFCFLLYDGLFYPEGTGKKYLFIISFALLILSAGIYTGFAFFTRLEKGYQLRDFTVLQRLFTQLRVVIHYLSLLIFPLPSRLNLDYDFSLSTGLLNPPATLYSLIIILATILAALFWHKRQPLFSFCIFWFWLNLLPESSIYPLDLVYEHRVYLPSMGFFLLLSTVLVNATESWKFKQAVAVMLVIPLCFFTRQRNKVWRDNELLWRDTVAKSPGKVRAHYNLADVYVQRGNYRKAVLYYQKAIELKPDFARAYNDQGYCYFYLGEVQKAIDLSHAALRYKPQMAEAHYNLAVYYLNRNEILQAKAELKKTLEINPQYPAAKKTLDSLMRR